MTATFIALFLFIVTSFSILVFYFLKVYWHLKLLMHLRRGKKKMTLSAPAPQDLVIFDWKNPEERAIRTEALMMYPLLFPVEIEEQDDEQAIRIKKVIKQWNIAIYLALIALFLSYIYLQKSGLK